MEHKLLAGAANGLVVGARREGNGTITRGEEFIRLGRKLNGA